MKSTPSIEASSEPARPQQEEPEVLDPLDLLEDAKRTLENLMRYSPSAPVEGARELVEKFRRLS